ncbi:MAG: aminoglycoside N(3)-acetyltransferase [Gemmatimonadota bacterium]
MHASVRAVGEIAGGPDQIHLAVKDALTPSGTLAMYAGVPRYVDEIGRGNLSTDEEQELRRKLPAFDPLTARADRSNGTLVEFFRTWPDSRVNEHPARFVVWGKAADYLISRQPWDYAYGRDSLFERFVELNGRILLLGSDHNNVTFLHYAEHVAPIANKRVARFLVPIMRDGERAWLDMAEYDTSSGVHTNWSPNFFAEIVDSYLLQSGNRGGQVGDALSFLIDARGLHAHALGAMQAVADDANAASELTKMRQEFLALRH